MKLKTTLDIAERMNLIDANTNEKAKEEVINHLEQKLQSIYQEHSLSIFKFSDIQIEDFL